MMGFDLRSALAIKSVLIALVFLLLPALPAFAVTITVDDTCTLAQAINAANEILETDKGDCETGSGADIILMPAASGTAISVTQQFPRLQSQMTIDGNNNVFDAALATRFFETWTGANVTLKRMTLRKGKATVAGAIRHRKGSLTLENVKIVENQSTGFGAGAIASTSNLTIKSSYFLSNVGTRESADQPSSISHDSGNLTISNSSFIADAGGYTAILVTSSGRTFRITNTTVALGQQGGYAIYIDPGSGLTSHVSHVTLQNRGIYFGKGTHHLRNSILFGASNDCQLYASATMSTNENNIIGENNCGGSPISADPRLSSPNPTHALPTAAITSGSPALDAAGDCTSITRVDQVGTARPQPAGGNCDIGAYEFPQSAPPPTAVPTEAPTDDPPPDDPPPDDPPPDDPPPDDPPPDDDDTTDDDTNNGSNNNRGNNNRNRGGSSGSGDSGGNSGSSGGDSASDDQAPAAVIIPTCLSLPSHISVSNITHLTQCQQVNAAGIGNAAVLDLGFRDGVDVWGWVLHDTQVCFEGNSGSFRFLDAATAPRAVSELPVVGRDGMICATINRAGTVALVNGPPVPAPSPTPPVYQSLSGCMVTTTFILNLRAAPAGDVIGAVPYNVTLTALERDDGWFKVDYHGAKGWISAAYVEPIGTCG